MHLSRGGCWGGGSMLVWNGAPASPGLGSPFECLRAVPLRKVCAALGIARQGEHPSLVPKGRPSCVPCGCKQTSQPSKALVCHQMHVPRPLCS